MFKIKELYFQVQTEIKNKKIVSLRELLSGYAEVSPVDERQISGLALDSRLVSPGDLFCAYSGNKEDGAKYIEDAIAKGAVAVLCSSKVEKIKNIPIFYLPNLQHIIGKLAAKFHEYPAENLTVIGVTGTNGKTSITQLIARSLEMLGKKCGIIGTLGVGFPDELTSTGLTTPDAITVQKSLVEFLEKGAEAVTVEASSHALDQGRLESANFKIAVFTNLTRDHLDYHSDMESYFVAKKILFQQKSLKTAVINIDDEYGRRLFSDLPKGVGAYAYSIEEDSDTKYPKIIRAKNIKMLPDGIKADLVTPWGEGELKTHLLGRFNLSNLLAVLATLCLLNIDFGKALKTLNALPIVLGRMQIVRANTKTAGPLVVIDYSHTPDALEKALKALREHCHGKLCCVFGCGGDRDRGKRPIMGRIAEQFSDHIVVTSDNPRSEDPEKILADVVSGLICPAKAKVEVDRSLAIHHAIKYADVSDVVLIAGKGHEDYQLIGKNKIPFSDYTKAKEALEAICFTG